MVVGSWPWGDTNGEMMTKTAKRYGTVSAALLMVAPSDLGDDITLASRHQRVVSLPPVLIWNKSKVSGYTCSADFVLEIFKFKRSEIGISGWPHAFIISCCWIQCIVNSSV